VNVLERIQKLSKENGISVGFLEENLGIGRGTIYKWNKSAPNTENLVKVADYFNVSIDYLLGRDHSSNEKDIAKIMDKMKKQLMNETDLLFDGEAMNPATIELLLQEIEQQERIIKALNKNYIPKKYR
jgi:transcriptional regulator with XRE-family HTH domain